MKLKIKLLSVFVLVVAMIAILAGCSYKSVITLNDLLLEFEPDGSIKQLSGDKSEELLSNIDRGFRIETYYTLGSGRAWPEDEGSDGYEMLEEELEFYKEDKAVEIQVYIYLTEYNKKPLDDLALNQMKDYFQYIRLINNTHISPLKICSVRKSINNGVQYFFLVVFFQCRAPLAPSSYNTKLISSYRIFYKLLVPTIKLFYLL